VYLISFLNLLVVRLVFNLELFKVDEMQTLSQFFLSAKYNTRLHSAAATGTVRLGNRTET